MKITWSFLYNNKNIMTKFQHEQSSEQKHIKITHSTLNIIEYTENTATNNVLYTSWI